MSDPNDSWNPDDGPAPTDEERALAQGLAAALDPQGAPRSVPGVVPGVVPGTEAAASDLDALVAAALRVRATAHPQPAAARAAAARAVTTAVAYARSPLVRARARWRWAAAAAAVLVTAAGVGSRELARVHGTAQVAASISRPATDVFDAPVEPGAGSMPSTRIYDSRLRSYRAVLLHGRTR